MSPRNVGLLSVALLAAAILPGCSPAQQVVGKWQVDMTKVTADINTAAQGNPLAAMVTGMMQAMKMEMEFKGDGNFIVSYNVMGQSGSEGGSWRYLKSEGDTLVLMMKGKKETAEREVRVRIVDADHMEMVPPAGAAAGAGKSFPFVRVKPS